MLRVIKLGEALGAAIEGVDLSRPLDAGTAEALRRAQLEHLVLAIRGQSLTPQGFRDAMDVFGKPVQHQRGAALHPEVPEIMILSSEDRDVLGDGKRLVVGAHWHSDDSYRAVPCSLTILYGVAVPERGGDTQFTNMYAAHDALDDEMKRRIAGLRVVHKYDSSRKGTRIATLSEDQRRALPDVVHPLVRTHPETGRKALYMNPNRMEAIVGMERRESDRLLDRLIRHAIEERFQYRHKWRRGDVLVWDNRCTMHKANADYPEGEKRLMHRIILEGTVPV
jgi:taurine dioxygenase